MTTRALLPASGLAIGILSVSLIAAGCVQDHADTDATSDRSYALAADPCKTECEAVAASLCQNGVDSVTSTNSSSGGIKRVDCPEDPVATEEDSSSAEPTLVEWCWTIWINSNCGCKIECKPPPDPPDIPPWKRLDGGPPPTYDGGVGSPDAGPGADAGVSHDLTAVKLVEDLNGDPVQPGDRLHYRILVGNFMSVPHAPLVQDVVPPALTNVVPLDGGSLSGGVITWQLPTLQPGGIAMVSFTADIDPSTPPTAQVSNQGFVDGVVPSDDPFTPIPFDPTTVVVQ